jgi:hypothetical protein
MFRFRCVENGSISGIPTVQEQQISSAFAIITKQNYFAGGDSIRVLPLGAWHSVGASVTKQRHNLRGYVASLLAAALLCAPVTLALADDATLQLPDSGLGAASSRQQVILPVSNPLPASGLAFDLGGSETRKLELQLSRPLTLDIANSLNRTPSGIGSVFLDSSLNLHLYDNLDITTSLGVGRSQTAFQPLGSIHCQNGVLEQGSYRASDCHFINQANVLKQDQVAMSLRYGNDDIGAAIGMFRNEASFKQRHSMGLAQDALNPGAGLLRPAPGATPFQAPALQSFDYLGGQSMGLGMEFQVGFTTDSAGDLQLGLQLTRVLDATYEAAPGFSPDFQSWTIANPFDSARVNLDWSKGSFSGGIQGFYRDQVQFMNRETLDSSTTFDVHFTWRAPWNANLSVGTSNVLNAGAEENGKADSKDPFEAVYGRIPYVRYQQDL